MNSLVPLSPDAIATSAAPIDTLLTPQEQSAARYLVWNVLESVPAELVEAALFGSKARGEARPDSDLDILLVFRDLPPDREPHAGIAEDLADRVAAETGVPVAVWSVSLPDLRPGARTPMLVDAKVVPTVVAEWLEEAFRGH